MIWSIIPEEIIFNNYDNSIKDNSQYERKTIDYLGKKVQTVPNGKGEARIIALISSNPEDFMDIRFSPGTIIKNQNSNLL